MIVQSIPKKASGLLHRSSVVGSISATSSLHRLNEFATLAQADLLELRLDHFPAAVADLCAQAPGLELPLLVTARCPAEGGKNDLTAAQRMELLRALLPHAAVIDIEISSLQEMAALVEEVKQSSVILVASFHDFHGTPTLAELQRLQEQALAAGADAVKFATTLTGPHDLATLVELLGQPDHPPLCLMGMGPLGKVSRLTLAQIGSIFNYGYLDAATVPGQWPAARLKSLLQEIATP
jgi:3-dehydroquinate dehydratase-1